MSTLTRRREMPPNKAFEPGGVTRMAKLECTISIAGLPPHRGRDRINFRFAPIRKASHGSRITTGWLALLRSFAPHTLG